MTSCRLAYSAALQSAPAALAAAGFRAAPDGHHYRVIQSLEFTIGLGQKVSATFDGFRKKRNIIRYDIAGAVSERQADEMVGLANMLRSRVEVWLRALHPQLFKTQCKFRILLPSMCWLVGRSPRVQ